MINVLNWNCKKFNENKKRILLLECFNQNKIKLVGIVGIQETKMESFSERILNKLSTTIYFWIVKPSQGNYGGILTSINDSLFQIIDQWILQYSITVCLKKKKMISFGYL
jgi:hypothetical protein